MMICWIGWRGGMAFSA